MKMTEENNAGKTNVTEEDVRLLIKRKDDIEEQIKAYHDMLQTAGVGMGAPLVDEEGFPRADVDLYKVRTARHNISCLQNDHKAIMVEIEEALHKLHASARVKPEKEETKMEVTEPSVSLPAPFALLDAVTQDSPAFQAVSLCPTSDLTLQSVTFDALVVNKQNCLRLAEEHCSRSYFSLFMSMKNLKGTGLLRRGTPEAI
ncbi:26S proteasome non-ATPase regulatory subunit 9-like isoform X2 [Carassius carassius]|uniref:26S proteasome non-ATPase regulatory subunit 9-like isoform X2 n=1 Tax=Carassius carassius TaxID=217509 RepID=UPI0028696B95|nr:26S proteasome non-ATPase regulatory subunit 9-like isoform X2 [Carassius carassius]